jgi:hypothetical protein
LSNAASAVKLLYGLSAGIMGLVRRALTAGHCHDGADTVAVSRLFEGVSAVENAARHLISPNLHVILVHFPLGVFVLGLFLEVFGIVLWSRSTARFAAKWMILLGGLLAVPAALTGIDAYQDVADHMQHMQTVEGMKMKVNGLDPKDQWPLIQKHILFASIGAGLAAIGVTIALGLSGTLLNRSYIYGPMLIVLIAAAGLMTYGSHFGGEGVYLGGVAVQVKKGAAQSGTIEWWAPARSTHILLAGFAMAAALGALGASWRLISTHGVVAKEEVDTDAELAALTERPESPVPPRRVTDDLSVARTLNADTEMATPRTPAGRFWLLSSLLFLITLGVGTWFLLSVEHQSDFDLKHATASTISHQVWETATTTKEIAKNRRGLHIGLGIALLVLPLFLAVASRWMYRARWVVGSLLILMAILIAAEIWIGVLLSFRGAEGPVYKFPAPAPTETQTA